ncbi:hypothetical protein GYMLUDRAFT_251118 [Collybiopsis luxurians FD-317 M1]|uniref:DUF6534 domain-containing protein n=1 Tax=Collybiopsis luxurians FD-317 M1 TaxID=944289 RepID=A0A0D0C3Z5_9AGAR|nr:hypothetical protein GYMLUDRAFT_251118 [Collybiopsis luxurians FD-317 M1]
MSLRACSAAVDTMISINMIYLLSGPNKPKFKSSQLMVKRILILAVNSTLITAVLATVTLILLAAQPKNLYYCIAEASTCSLYFSTLLANLNARDYIRGEPTPKTFSNIVEQTEISLSPISCQQGINRVRIIQESKASDMVVNIETSTSVRSDCEQDPLPTIKA